MPPEIPVALHVTVLSGPPDRNTGYDCRGPLHGFIGNGLQLGGLPTPVTPVCGHQDVALGIGDPFGQCFHAETSVNDTVGRADFGTCQHGNDELGDLGHVYGHDFPLFCTHGFQYIRKLRDFPVQGIKGKCPDIAGFALPDQGQLIPGIGTQVPVNGIGNDVDLSSRIPFVKWLIRVIQDLVPWLVPHQFLGLYIPEPLPVLNGFLVQAVIILYP